MEPSWKGEASDVTSNLASMAASLATLRRYSSSVVDPLTPGTAEITFPDLSTLTSTTTVPSPWYSYFGLGRLQGSSSLQVIGDAFIAKSAAFAPDI